MDIFSEKSFVEIKNYIFTDIALFDVAIIYIVSYVFWSVMKNYLYLKKDKYTSVISRNFLLFSFFIITTTWGLRFFQDGASYWAKECQDFECLIVISPVVLLMILVVFFLIKLVYEVYGDVLKIKTNPDIIKKDTRVMQESHGETFEDETGLYTVGAQRVAPSKTKTEHPVVVSKDIPVPGSIPTFLTLDVFSVVVLVSNFRGFEYIFLYVVLGLFFAINIKDPFGLLGMIEGELKKFLKSNSKS